MILPGRALAPLWVLALLLPAPALPAAVAVIPMCSGGAVRAVLPLDQPKPASSDHDCCRKACHAGSDRRKRHGLLSDTCC
ncbi:MAG: hypothetical protein ACKOXK_00130 [Chakrabartia sp.]